jgi:hypothetical protein
MQITSNEIETSRTMRISQGNIDFAVFRQDRDFIIGLTDNGGNVYREIRLSTDEARQLRDHLNDQEAMAVLGIRDVVGVRCPACGEMVESFINHPCKGNVA